MGIVIRGSGDERIDAFDRDFQIWEYLVSHGQLLLRSTKNNEQSTQVDVLFKDIAFIQMPTTFSGLRILRSEWSQVSPSDSLGKLGSVGRYPYLVSGSNWTGLVVAGAVAWIEDDLDYFAESKLLSR